MDGNTAHTSIDTEYDCMTDRTPINTGICSLYTR